MITLTKAASFRIREMMEGEEKTLRFGVTGGGCSGLSYTLNFADKFLETDTFIESEGIKIVLSNKDIPIIKGTVIDYKQSLMGGGFTIDNPNAIITCGCGTSFKTKNVSGTPSDC